MDRPAGADIERLPSRETFFSVGDRFLRATTDCDDVRNYLVRAYRRLLSDGDARACVPVDAAGIVWDGSAAQLTFEGARLPRVDGSDPLAAAVPAAAALFGMSFRRMGAQRALYAAGLAAGTSALALVGDSGAGKTTLVLEMLRRGWQTYGDEFLLLDRRTLVARAFPLGLAVRETSLANGSEPRVARACAGATFVTGVAGRRTFHGIDIVDVFGDRALAAARPLTHLILLERAGGGAPLLEPLPSAVAALKVLPHFFIDALAMSDVWETVEAMSRLACYRLSAPDVRAAAALLETLAGT